MNLPLRAKLACSLVAVLIVVIGALMVLQGASGERDGVAPISPDQMLVDVHREVPGFGGIFVDPSDNTIAYVYLLDPSRQEDAERAVSLMMVGREVSEIRVLQGDYPIDVLAAWYVRLRDVASIDGVFWSDLNEGKNRLQYGVRDRSTVKKVEQFVRAAGVPLDAVIIRISEEPRPVIDLPR